MRFAYLSQGKLFVCQDGKEPRQIESPFNQKTIDAAADSSQRQSWKSESNNPFGGAMLWNVQEANPAQVALRMTAVTHSEEPEEIAYFQENFLVGGYFVYNMAAGEERRIFHKEHFRARDADRHPETHWIAMAQMYNDGTANIALMNDDGTDRREITGGESMDLAPSWVPGAGYRIVFQSAGLARTPDGIPLGHGPSSIELLDIQSGEMKTLLEDEQYDYMLPHMTAAGDLYYLRRKHEPIAKPTGLGRMALDSLLFPFRFIFAIFHAINAFTHFMTGKPASMGAGRQLNQEQQLNLMIRGRMIDLKKLEREERLGDAGLVPQTWELMRRGADGKDASIAKGVASYDLGRDGSIVYTNGRTVYHLADGGKPQAVAKEKVIEEVVVL